MPHRITDAFVSVSRRMIFQQPSFSPHQHLLIRQTPTLTHPPHGTEFYPPHASISPSTTCQRFLIRYSQNIPLQPYVNILSFITSQQFHILILPHPTYTNTPSSTTYINPSYPPHINASSTTHPKPFHPTQGTLLHP